MFDMYLQDRTEEAILQAEMKRRRDDEKGKNNYSFSFLSPSVLKIKNGKYAADTN